jgi:hypothetical protein
VSKSAASTAGPPPTLDRILRGATPAERPLQAPTKFELVINGRSAHGCRPGCGWNLRDLIAGGVKCVPAIDFAHVDLTGSEQRQNSMAAAVSADGSAVCVLIPSRSRPDSSRPRSSCNIVFIGFFALGLF